MGENKKTMTLNLTEREMDRDREESCWTLARLSVRPGYAAAMCVEGRDFDGTGHLTASLLLGTFCERESDC